MQSFILAVLLALTVAAYAQGKNINLVYTYCGKLSDNIIKIGIIVLTKFKNPIRDLLNEFFYFKNYFTVDCDGACDDPESSEALFCRC